MQSTHTDERKEGCSSRRKTKHNRMREQDNVRPVLKPKRCKNPGKYSKWEFRLIMKYELHILHCGFCTLLDKCFNTKAPKTYFKVKNNLFHCIIMDDVGIILFSHSVNIQKKMTDVNSFKSFLTVSSKQDLPANLRPQSYLNYI